MKTILNFRNCGGLVTVDTCTAPNAVRCKCGRYLRQGRVYRSGTLDDARVDDLHALHTLGLKTIVDLRAPREKKKAPAQVDGTRRVDLPIELETRTREKIEPLMTKRGAEQEVVDILQQMYRELADEAWP